MIPTPAELDVLRRLAEPGATQATVAKDLGITPHAVNRRLRRLYRRLGVNSPLQAWVAAHERLA